MILFCICKNAVCCSWSSSKRQIERLDFGGTLRTCRRTRATHSRLTWWNNDTKTVSSSTRLDGTFSRVLRRVQKGRRVVRADPLYAPRALLIQNGSMKISPAAIIPLASARSHRLRVNTARHRASDDFALATGPRPAPTRMGGGGVIYRKSGISTGARYTNWKTGEKNGFAEFRKIRAPVDL